LFGVLDDVARYTAGYSGTEMLGQVWVRISDLLLANAPAIAPGCCLAMAGAGSADRRGARSRADPCCLRTAVDIVGQQEVGTTAWWLAVHSAARAYDEHCRHLTGSG